MKKQILSLLLFIVTSTVIVSCGGKKDGKSTTNEATSTSLNAKQENSINQSENTTAKPESVKLTEEDRSEIKNEAKKQADEITKNMALIDIFKGRELYLNAVNMILDTKIDKLSIYDGLKDDLTTFKTEIDNTITGIKYSQGTVPKSLEELSAKLQAKIDACDRYTKANAPN